MALLPSRRRKKRQREQEKAMESAYNKEQRRQKNLMKQQYQQDYAMTQEGVGFMEGANISLGRVEDEEEEYSSLTGLML